MNKKNIFSIMIILAFIGTPFFVSNQKLVSTNEMSKNSIQKINLSTIQSSSSNFDNSYNSYTKAENKYQLTQESPTYSYPNTSTVIKLNATSYNPGDTALINITSNKAGLNGSLSWNLQNPLQEMFFSFKNEATNVVFSDPDFSSAPLLKDWENNASNGFKSVTASESLNALVLQSDTNITGSSTNIISIVNYNNSNQILDGNYRFSFDRQTVGDMGLLILNAWNGTSYNQYNVSSSASKLTFSQDNITIGKTNGQKAQLFFSNYNSNSTWYLSNFRIFYSYSNVFYQMTGASEKLTGTISEIYQDHAINVQNKVSIKYSASYFDTENFTYANFTIRLPIHSVYLGNWKFSLTYEPYGFDSENNLIPIATNPVTYNIPINITDSLIFQPEKTFVKRGFNDTLGTPIFEDETNQTNIFSPTDEITVLGKIVTKSTNETYSGTYFSSIKGYLESNASDSNLKSFSFGSTSSQLYHFDNTSSNSIATGNFTQANLPDLDKIWGITYSIPERGLYGNISNTLEISFPSSLTFDDSVTPLASQDAAYSYFLNKNQIKFNTVLVSDTLPFDRVWFITEFLEGSFTVNTTVYNTTLNSNYPNHNITNFINIPRSDLNFSVYFAPHLTDTPEMEFTIALSNNVFSFGGIIDPNLKIPNDYDLKIVWQDALNAKDYNKAKMIFIETQTDSYTLHIQGTLKMELPLETYSVHQDENLKVSFNATIEELNRPAKGLQLYGVLCSTASTTCNTTSDKIAIEEKDGTFTIFYTIATTIDPGNYKLEILNLNQENLGYISVVVLPKMVNNPDIREPEFLVLIGAGLVTLILLGYVGVIIIKYK